MRVCRLTQGTIDSLYEQWDKFYNKRLSTLKYIRDKKMREWEDERDGDLRAERYSRSSIFEWFDDKLRQMDEWYNKCLSNLKRDDQYFRYVVQRAASDVFSHSLYGKTVVYDFCDGKVYTEPYENPNSVNVWLRTYTSTYTYEPYEIEVDFADTKPQFTEWYDY